MLQRPKQQTVEPAEDKINQLVDLVGYHLRRASVFDLQGASAALEPVHSRPVPTSILLCIRENPGITSAEICRHLGMQRANIVSLLTDLEARGLFLRQADATDQRIQRLYLTKDGQDAAAHWLDLISAHEDKMLARLDGAERRELRRLLSKIWQEDAEEA